MHERSYVLYIRVSWLVIRRRLVRRASSPSTSAASTTASRTAAAAYDVDDDIKYCDDNLKVKDEEGNTEKTELTHSCDGSDDGHYHTCDSGDDGVNSTADCAED